jgi:hypothetical protein
MKDKLKKGAAEIDYAKIKEEEQEKLSKVESSKREIQFNLNRVAPENVKDIYNEIKEYATGDEEVCEVLVESIIEKAWEQPKYAASYAKLSSYFSRIEANEFKFNEKEANEKKNPFKYILIEKVQHSFDKKWKKEAPKTDDQLEKEKFFRETKNLVIGSTQFLI